MHIHRRSTGASGRLLTLGLALGVGTSAAAQDMLPPLPVAGPSAIPSQHHAHAAQGVLAKFNRFLPFDSAQPVTVSELCSRLDCLTEELRDDGLILMKQPDVFSQARLTRFRNDFDNQMSQDLGNFQLVLAARINRLDSATTTQTTALGASLAAPGTTNMYNDPTKFIGSVSGAGTNNPFPSAAPSLFGSSFDATKGAFGSLSTSQSTLHPPASNNGTLGLGVDPTVYLDEKKRFLEHLNQIRRISQGPDQNDSSGYGLYLVRMPVSIQPGECTEHGHGADLSLNVEHEFAPDFLPSTFQNLVINDVVDQVGPFLYETIRTPAFDNLEKHYKARLNQPAFETRITRFVEDLIAQIEDRVLVPQPGLPPALPPISNEKWRDQLTGYLLRTAQPLTGDQDKDRVILETIARRVEVLANYFDPPDLSLLETAGQIRQGQGFSHLLATRIAQRIDGILPKIRPDLIIAASSGPRAPMPSFNMLNPFLKKLYLTAFPDDVNVLDDLFGITDDDRTSITKPLAANNDDLFMIIEDQPHQNLSLPSSRSPKQQYPIAPRELLNFLLQDNVYLMSKDAKEAGRTKNPNVSEIRTYLRHTLKTAYYLMGTTTDRVPGSIAPLADQEYMDRLFEAIRQRQFRGLRAPGANDQKSNLESLNAELVARISMGRDNVKDTPIGALCWAIAVDAAILDKFLRQDAQRVGEAHGRACDLNSVRFYLPNQYPNEIARDVFLDYVKQRWPIITFSLDPVSDQQNIADSFNLKRDLQLAVSFAFATGQISFNQLNTFRRQIEQSSDTVALNRTVTGFSYSNDNFGFRFTPRFQNPPNQRTNIGAITSQLIGGGPGPDYQVKKSKLEPGMREITAVLLIPDFLPTMRLNMSSNWFKLNDPEHLVFHTGRAMERGRRVQELRKAVIDTCNEQTYRSDDLRVLRKKLAQLEAMLPQQSTVVQLPYDNMANGFDLLSEGSAALAPELTGFSGVDIIKLTPANVAAAAAFPAPGTSGVQLISTTNGSATTQTLNAPSVASSIADIFVFGKFLNLLDTRVVAGGRSAAFELLSREVIHVQIPANVTPTTTEEGKTYIEVYVSTPNGISNTLLVPCDPGTAPTPTPLVAFDLASGSSAVTVYYQSLKGADGNPTLVATADPKGNDIAITWDDPAGFAPKQLRVIFDGTINNQPFRFTQNANPGIKDNFAIDARSFTRTLLASVQNMVGATGTVPPSLVLTLSVQPFLPNDTDNYRVQTKPKPLTTKMTVTFQYFATGVDAISSAPADGQTSTRASRGDRGLAALADPRMGPGKGTHDPDLARTRAGSQIMGLPPLPQLPTALNAPQPAPATYPPALLAPNVASEAEQVARLLTGQPLPPNPVPGQPNSVVAVSTTPAAGNGNPGSNIVVMPAPVVVVPAKEVPKKHGSTRQGRPSVLKKIGNRISNALPGAGN